MPTLKNQVCTAYFLCTTLGRPDHMGEGLELPVQCDEWPPPLEGLDRIGAKVAERLVEAAATRVKKVRW